VTRKADAAFGLFMAFIGFLAGWGVCSIYTAKDMARASNHDAAIEIAKEAVDLAEKQSVRIKELRSEIDILRQSQPEEPVHIGVGDGIARTTDDLKAERFEDELIHRDPDIRKAAASRVERAEAEGDREFLDEWDAMIERRVREVNR
jgi:hypothetical protein